jgi:hypothetical protein
MVSSEFGGVRNVPSSDCVGFRLAPGSQQVSRRRGLFSRADSADIERIHRAGHHEVMKTQVTTRARRS